MWPALRGAQQGYYRHPVLNGNTLIFVSEGDLWRVSPNVRTPTVRVIERRDEMRETTDDSRKLQRHFLAPCVHEGSCSLICHLTEHVQGGLAIRLTSHAGAETWPVISPDGMTVAFVAQFEGVAEVCTH